MIEETVIGRIIESTMENARCEFISDVKLGDPVRFKQSGTEIRGRIEHLEVLSTKGLQGWIIFTSRPSRPPKPMTPIHPAETDKGGILSIGHTYRGEEVKLPLNPLYRHLNITGKTQMGKTHTMIVLAEELAEHNIPAIIFDPQGEFTNLPKAFDNTLVTDGMEPAELIKHLQERHIVIFNYLGMSNEAKSQRLGATVSELKVAKETDYAQADNEMDQLTIPPILIFVDEGDVFAPREVMRSRAFNASAEALEEIAQRGSKLGLGLIISTQRIAKLAIDIRDNCNSMMAFSQSGRSNKFALGNTGYITKHTINRLKTRLRGECILVGAVSGGQETIKIRDLKTERTKKTDFEQLLGLKGEKKKEKQKIQEISNGKLVDIDTGQVLKTAAERVYDEDDAAFQEAGGDGVVPRDEPLPDTVVEELTEAALTDEEREDSEDEDNPYPFDTHITKEDRKLIEQLRGKDNDNFGHGLIGD